MPIPLLASPIAGARKVSTAPGLGVRERLPNAWVIALAALETNGASSGEPRRCHGRSRAPGNTRPNHRLRRAATAFLHFGGSIPVAGLNGCGDGDGVSRDQSSKPAMDTPGPSFLRVARDSLRAAATPSWQMYDTATTGQLELLPSCHPAGRILDKQISGYSVNQDLAAPLR